MDLQGISIEKPPSRVLRLALVFLGALFGLLVLSVAFGSSTASASEADDSPDSLGSALGGLVSSVTEPVQHTVTAVTHVVQPVTAPIAKPITQAPAVKPVTDAVATAAQAAPAAQITVPVAALVDGTLTKILGDSPLGSAIGPRPVGAILTPVSDLVDGTVAQVTEAASAPGATSAVVATAASLAPVAAVALSIPIGTVQALSGMAGGHLLVSVNVPGDTGSAGISASGASLFAAIAGAGFLVLLRTRRTLLADRAMPGSPVFDTDSSPD